MRRAGVDVRLVPPALAAWLASGFGVSLAPPAAWAWAAGAAFAAGCLILVAAASRVRVRAITAVFGVSAATAALVLAAVAAHAPARHPEALAALGARTVTLTATVSSGMLPAPDDAFGGGERMEFRATARTVEGGRISVRAAIPVLVFADRASPPPLGSTVELRGTLKPQPREDATSLLVFAGGVRVVAGPPWWIAWADALRARFSAASAALPGDGGALLPGLAIGDVSRAAPALQDAMKAASLSHLTAVSGANCAVVAGGALALAAAAGVPRRARVGIAGAALLGFVVLVTPSASVVRAAAMAVVLLLGAWGGRPARALPALALAVVVLLAGNPWLARDYGFALSVAATAGLLLLAGPLATRMQRLLPRWLALSLSVPIAAQLACQPILILLNPTMPLYGVVANLLAEPGAPVATVVGLLACLALALVPPLGQLLLRIAWLPAAWIAAVARRAAKLPGASLPWPGGAAGVLAAAALTALIVLLVTRLSSRRARAVRGICLFAVAMMLVSLGAAGAGPALARRLSMPRDWAIAACDIGQGDAVLVRSGGMRALIDVGPDPDALAECLKTLGIRHLDLLVLTHYDLDHVGGLDAVLGITGLALVGPPDDDAAGRRLARLEQSGARVQQAARGDTGALGALRWSVLWPDPARAGMQSGNEGSVTLRVDGADGFSAVFLGDLDQAAQAALLRSGGIRPALVVKMAHHGSADQDPGLYRALQARIAIISAGTGNDYGHPTRQALGMLRETGTRPVRTDLEGMALLTPQLRLWTRKGASEAALWTPARRGP